MVIIYALCVLFGDKPLSEGYMLCSDTFQWLYLMISDILMVMCGY